MTKKITARQIAVILTVIILITALTASVFRAVEDNNNNNTQTTQTTSNLYVMRAAVVQIDKDLVICEDTNGEAWSFEGADEWAKDDEVILLINDNNTEEIYDDEIIDVRIDPSAYLRRRRAKLIHTRKHRGYTQRESDAHTQTRGQDIQHTYNSITLCIVVCMCIV